MPSRKPSNASVGSSRTSSASGRELGVKTVKNQVKVILRVRPRFEHEQDSCIVVENEKDIRIINPRNENETLLFSFAGCYDDQALQETIFEQHVAPLLPSAFDGINTCVFAYGITGAGKTFTIQGTAAQPGVIPRAVQYYLSAIEAQSYNCQMSVSFFEIYCENVIDLLVPRSKSKSLDVREDASRSIIVAGLSEVTVKSIKDFNKAFDTASANRSVASTNLNAHSSRSHLIMRIMLKTKRGSRSCVGKVHIVDLAGSENNKKTGNVGKERMAESGAINKSLFTLSQVVDALNEGKTRIPYRESKMTRILQDSLGGNSQAVMIVAIAGSQQFYTDTYNTLNFASKSKKIINNPTVNESIGITNQPPISAVERQKRLAKWQEEKARKLGHHDRLAGSTSATGITGLKRKNQDDHLRQRAQGLVSSKDLYADFDTKMQELSATLEKKLEEKVKCELELRQGVLAGQMEDRIKGDVMNTLMKTLESQEQQNRVEMRMEGSRNIPNTPNTRRFLADRSQERARKFIATGDHYRAREEYEIALSLIPDDNALVSEAFDFECKHFLIDESGASASGQRSLDLSWFGGSNNGAGDITNDSIQDVVTITEQTTVLQNTQTHQESSDILPPTPRVNVTTIATHSNICSPSPILLRQRAVTRVLDNENTTPIRAGTRKRRRQRDEQDASEDEDNQANRRKKKEAGPRSFFDYIENSHDEIGAFLDAQEQRTAAVNAESTNTSANSTMDERDVLLANSLTEDFDSALGIGLIKGADSSLLRRKKRQLNPQKRKLDVIASPFNDLRLSLGFGTTIALPSKIDYDSEIKNCDSGIFTSESGHNRGQQRLLKVLNTGDLKVIKTLKGIGEKKADQIRECVMEEPLTSMTDLRRAGFTDKFIERFALDNAQVI